MKAKGVNPDRKSEIGVHRASQCCMHSNLATSARMLEQFVLVFAL